MNKLFFLVMPLLFIGARSTEKPKQDILTDTVKQSEILLKNAEKYAATKGIEIDSVNYLCKQIK